MLALPHSSHACRSSNEVRCMQPARRDRARALECVVASTQHSRLQRHWHFFNSSDNETDRVVPNKAL